METQKLWPAPGRKVRDPKTKKELARDGEVKPVDAFWTRRVQSGDCVTSPPTQGNTHVLGAEAPAPVALEQPAAPKGNRK